MPSITKLETKLANGKRTDGKMEEQDACHDFQLEFLIGKEAVKIFKEESELPSDHPYPESEFIGILIN